MGLGFWALKRKDRPSRRSKAGSSGFGLFMGELKI
jgi:hypothetical protein